MCLLWHITTPRMHCIEGDPLALQLIRFNPAHSCVLTVQRATAWLSLLQDHFRQVVKPCFTEVYRDRGEAIGVAEFETMEDMRTAIRRLDDTEFKNPFEKSYIRIIEVSTGQGAAGMLSCMLLSCSPGQPRMVWATGCGGQLDPAGFVWLKVVLTH